MTLLWQSEESSIALPGSSWRGGAGAEQGITAALGMKTGTRLVCGVLQAGAELAVQARAWLLVCTRQEGCSPPQKVLC